MFTRKALNNYVHKFLLAIHEKGYKPMRVVLFGSYAYGRPHELSDIDLAIWDARFTGFGAIDIEPIASIVSKFPALELHTFPSDEGPEENPFVKKGVVIFENKLKTNQPKAN